MGANIVPSDLSRKKERTQINKIKNQRGDIETDTKKIQRFITGCHEQWYPKQSVQTRRKG